MGRKIGLLGKSIISNDIIAQPFSLLGKLL